MRMGFKAVLCYPAVFLGVLASQACVSTVPIPYRAGLPLHASMDYATVWGTYLYQYSAIRRRTRAVYTIPIFDRPKPELVAELPQPCQTCRPRTTTFSSEPSWPPTYQLGCGSANYHIVLVRSRGLTPTLPRTLGKHPDFSSSAAARDMVGWRCDGCHDVWDTVGWRWLFVSNTNYPSGGYWMRFHGNLCLRRYLDVAAGRVHDPGPATQP